MLVSAAIQRPGANPLAGNGLRADHGSVHMAQDPVSAVAAWITPATDDDAEDPILIMLAERERLYALAGDAREKGEEIEDGLPDDVRTGKVLIDLPPIFPGFWSKAGIEEMIASSRRLTLGLSEILDDRAERRERRDSAENTGHHGGQEA